jgi:hypothetical protein
MIASDAKNDLRNDAPVMYAYAAAIPFNGDTAVEQATAVVVIAVSIMVKSLGYEVK